MSWLYACFECCWSQNEMNLKTYEKEKMSTKKETSACAMLILHTEQWMVLVFAITFSIIMLRKKNSTLPNCSTIQRVVSWVGGLYSVYSIFTQFNFCFLLNWLFSWFLNWKLKSKLHFIASLHGTRWSGCQ